MKQYPVPAAEMQNQSAQWLNVRRDRPDWMIMWGWGAMNPTAVKEAAKINFPMDKFIGIWWSGGEDDARPTGAESQGLSRRSTSTASAPNYPGDPGHQEARRRQGQEPDRRRTSSARTTTTAACYNSVLIAEAIRNAQKITGKKVVTGEDVRRGFETLKITAARWKELGLEDFARADHQRDRAPTTTATTRPTCSNGTAPSG